MTSVKTSAASALLPALLILAAFAITGCGDDDDASEGSPTIAATDAAYLEALAPALQAVNAQLDGLDELRTDAFDDGPDAAAADAYGLAYETFASDRLAAIEALTPEEDLTDEHAALVSAAGDGVLLAQELRTELGKSPPASDAEFLDLFGRLDGATIGGRYHDACTALQSSATSGGLSIDLQCLL